MSIYLGQLGRLVELKCPASQQVTPEERYTFQTTLEGRQKAQSRPVGRRVWSLATSDATAPREQAAIMAFANGEWGPGPFVFVSADAPVMNMMSPGAASCDPAENPSALVDAGGPMLTPDGWAGRSYLNPQNVAMFFGKKAADAATAGGRIPVIPGQKITAAAYVRGAGAYARVAFYDVADAQISVVNSPVTATATDTRRSWLTATVPPNAVACRVIAVNTAQGCRPSVTWTDTLLDWADGQGCPKAVLHDASRSLVMASRDPRGGRYSNIGFTATEVG